MQPPRIKACFLCVCVCHGLASRSNCLAWALSWVCCAGVICGGFCDRRVSVAAPSKQGTVLNTSLQAIGRQNGKALSLEVAQPPIDACLQYMSILRRCVTRTTSDLLPCFDHANTFLGWHRSPGILTKQGPKYSYQCYLGVPYYNYSILGPKTPF